jgi:hypothetical protein
LALSASLLPRRARGARFVYSLVTTAWIRAPAPTIWGRSYSLSSLSKKRMEKKKRLARPCVGLSEAHAWTIVTKLILLLFHVLYIPSCNPSLPKLHLTVVRCHSVQQPVIFYDKSRRETDGQTCVSTRAKEADALITGALVKDTRSIPFSYYSSWDELPNKEKSYQTRSMVRSCRHHQVNGRYVKFMCSRFLKPIDSRMEFIAPSPLSPYDMPSVPPS